MDTIEHVRVCNFLMFKIRNLSGVSVKLTYLYRKVKTIGGLENAKKI